MKLRGKVAIITGGARGIGKAFALRFAEEGAAIVIADVLDGKPAAEEIAKKGSQALALTTDVTSEESTRLMVQSAVDSFGRVDILVNNAGIFANLGKKPFYEISGEEWDRVLAVNLKGMFNCCKAVFPQMKQQGRGRIINMASTTALAGIPLYIHYVASKGAVITLTRALARELGDYGIGINAIAPGLVASEAVRDNPMYPPEYQQQISKARCFKRLEVPEDLTGAAVFLASEDSDFMTGQTLNIDGGMYMH